MLTTSEHRKLGGDCTMMVGLDRYVSAHKPKHDIVKEFIENMTDDQFDKFHMLPESRRALLLRRYAEKNHGTNLGIVPYTS